MTEDIASQLGQYIAQKILRRPQQPIRPEDKLISSGLIDSFHLVDLSLYVEDTFGVRLDDTELNVQTFDTLAQLSDLIAQRRSSS
jgi:acyl carrier protein